MSGGLDHSAARETLAFPALETNSPDRTTSASPIWTRPSTYRRSTSLTSQQRPARTWYGRLSRRYRNLDRMAKHHVNRLTPVQQVLVGIGGLVAIVLGILLLVYNERIFAALEPFAKKWRDLRGGWLILWVATFIVSFPPLIGYSSCVTLSGFVYGFPHGWLIVGSATIVGSTCSFLTSRYLLHNFVDRLLKNDSRFAALALTLKHDGLKLLIMIRLCPLPYSLSNGALSTIPTVTWQSFLFATAIVSPKLLLHVFVGAKLGELAEKGKQMDMRTKAISYVSIMIGVVAGAVTGWVIYSQTKKRAAELEAQEGGAGHVAGGRQGSRGAEYADDPAALEAAEYLREEEDDISLRDAWEDEYGYSEEERDGEDNEEEQEDQRHPGRGMRGAYRDELSGDEDAMEVQDDVFDAGDGTPGENRQSR